MGFEVKDDGFVMVNHDHNRFGNTDINGNPTKAQSSCGLTVHSVFKRLPHKSKAPKSELRGDNCPLIYALKGADGLYTEVTEVKKLIPPGKQILDTFISDKSEGYDLILPMPSNHSISLILARRVHKLLPKSSIIVTGLRKATVRQVFQQLKDNDLGHNANAAISKQLKKMEQDVGLDGLFSIKNIPTRYRRDLSPVVLTDALPDVASRILLVDDLFSTGSTLFGARNLLQRYMPNAKIEALCLFSPYKGKIRR